MGRRNARSHDPMSDLVVAALAGRRVDAVDADRPRFPADAVPAVAAALDELFVRSRVNELVCSAACGADLLALEAAARHGIDATIVLPFPPPDFRRTSVVDRPGDWGALFDRVISAVEASGRLVVLDLKIDDPTAYDRATARIVSIAAARPADQRLGVVVWDGASRGNGDATADFAEQALIAGFRIREVATLESGIT